MERSIAGSALWFALLPGCGRASGASPPAGKPVDAAAAVSVEPTTVAMLPRIPPPPDVAAPPPDATASKSGLVTRLLVPGKGGPQPTVFDLVRLRFVAWTKDGNTFNASSVDPNGEPITVRVNDGGIPGLAEGLTLMTEGETRRMWIPAAIASSDGPRPDLVMDVELVTIVRTPKPPPLPEDASEPPATARRTRSGLAWRPLRTGAKGAARAEPESIAVFNRTIWDRSTGMMTSSSFPYGDPEKGLVSVLAPPWSEAIPLMKVGDSIRIWFDADKGRLFVADLELLYVYPLVSRSPSPARGVGRR